VTRPSRGVSLLEVVLSGALLLVVSFVVISALAPVHQTTGESFVSVDMDEAAARVLQAISRELRQSGHQEDGTDMISLPLPGRVLETSSAPAPVDLLVFQRRLGLDQWAPATTYRAVPDGVFQGATPPLGRYRLVRVDAVGGEFALARNITCLRVERIAESGLFKLRLELTRRNPNEAGVRTRSYEEWVLPLNPDPDR
jgi:hypothetical protein